MKRICVTNIITVSSKGSKLCLDTHCKALTKWLLHQSSNYIQFMTCYSLWLYFTCMAQVWKAEKMWITTCLHERHSVGKLLPNKGPVFPSEPFSLLQWRWAYLLVGRAFWENNMNGCVCGGVCVCVLRSRGHTLKIAYWKKENHNFCIWNAFLISWNTSYPGIWSNNKVAYKSLSQF